MAVAYPPFTSKLAANSAFGMAKEAVYRTPVLPTAFSPFTACTMDIDPALFSPAVMMGVRSTHIYNLSGEEKAGGAVSMPLYTVNAVPLLVASVGQDGTAHNGVFGGVPLLASAGSPAHSASSTSFAAAGVTSITATSITGTYAVGNVIQISGSTDAALPDAVPDIQRISAFSTPTITSTATDSIHTGTIALKVVGAVVASGFGATATTGDVASGMGALFTIGDYVTFDKNSATTTAETRKITNISTDTLTLDAALVYAHAANAVVYRVDITAPMVHTIPLGASVDSFTFEKNLANAQSLQFAGSRVGKLTLNCPTGNNAANIAADIQASAIAILDSPTAVTTDASAPLTFRQARLKLFGTARYEACNLAMTLDNGLKETYTYTGSGFPTFIDATDLHVNGKFDVTFDSLDDATYGDYANIINGVEGALEFLMQNSADLSFIRTSMPKVRLSKSAITPAPASILMSNLTFEARYAIESATPATIILTVGTVGRYLAY